MYLLLVQQCISACFLFKRFSKRLLRKIVFQLSLLASFQPFPQLCVRLSSSFSYYRLIRSLKNCIVIRVVEISCFILSIVKSSIQGSDLTTGILLGSNIGTLGLVNHLMYINLKINFEYSNKVNFQFAEGLSNAISLFSKTSNYYLMYDL